jgi:hypothetical protein
MTRQEMISERERAAAIMARYKAKSEVKRQLAVQGVNLATVSSREFALLADDYLATHREELLERARNWLIYRGTTR